MAAKERFCGNHDNEVRQSSRTDRGPFRDRPSPSSAGVVKKRKSLDSETTLTPETRLAA